jgi:hypothetical protein
LHHSFRRTFCRLVRVVSRLNTGVRQTILDVICGRSRFFAVGRGFGFRVVASVAARTEPMLFSRSSCRLRRGWQGVRQRSRARCPLRYRVAACRGLIEEPTLAGLRTGNPDTLASAAPRCVECVVLLARVACGEGRGHGETNTVHLGITSEFGRGATFDR